jgi:hypothetical protein
MNLQLCKAIIFTGVSICASMWGMSCGPPNTQINTKSGLLPAWVLQPHRDYPSELYMVGIGSASTEPEALQAASAVARAELVQSIEVRVTHDQNFSNRSTSSEMFRNNQMRIAYDSARSDLATITNTSTNQVIQGIDIKETFYSPNEKVIYALAVLEKSSAADLLERQVNDLVISIDAGLSHAEPYKKQNNILMALRYYRSVYSHSLQLDVLRNRLHALDPERTYRISMKSADDVGREVSELLQKYRLSVVVDGDDAPGIKEALTNALTSSGFDIAQRGRKSLPGATLNSEFRADWDVYWDKGLDQELQVCRVYLNVRVVDWITNNTVGQINWAENSNGKTRERALRTALRLLERSIDEDLSNELYEVLSIDTGN